MFEDRTGNTVVFMCCPEMMMQSCAADAYTAGTLGYCLCDEHSGGGGGGAELMSTFVFLKKIPPPMCICIMISVSWGLLTACRRVRTLRFRAIGRHSIARARIQQHFKPKWLTAFTGRCPSNANHKGCNCSMTITQTVHHRISTAMGINLRYGQGMRSEGASAISRCFLIFIVYSGFLKGDVPLFDDKL